MQHVFFEVEEVLPGGEPKPWNVLYMQCWNARQFEALTTPQAFYGLDRDLSGNENLTANKGRKLNLWRVWGSGSIWG